MAKQVNIFARGIMGTLDQRDWDRVYAARYMAGAREETHTGIPFVYAGGVVGSTFWISTQAKRLADLVQGYNDLGYVPDLSGHSHAPEIFRQVLLNYPVRVRHVRMAGAATNDDVSSWEAACAKIAGEICLLCSPNDSTLRTFGGAEGYGRLGLLGPRNIPEAFEAKLAPVEWYQGDHCDYFDFENDARTYARMTMEEALCRSKS